ncbi:uncharacterized protein LJ206_014563 isoform 1-T1 [Theristicus caerulescens]
MDTLGQWESFPFEDKARGEKAPPAELQCDERKNPTAGANGNPQAVKLTSTSVVICCPECEGGGIDPVSAEAPRREGRPMEMCLKSHLHFHTERRICPKRVTLNLMNFHSLNKQEDHVEKNVSGDIVFVIVVHGQSFDNEKNQNPSRDPGYI